MALVLPRPTTGLNMTVAESDATILSNSATPRWCGSDDGVQRTALGLGEQVAELRGAHPDPGTEVVGEHDTLLGWGGFIDEQLRAAAVALIAESGERLGGGDVEHGYLRCRCLTTRKYWRGYTAQDPSWCGA